MHLLLTNIKQLCNVEIGEERKPYAKGEEMKQMKTLENAWLLIENGLIKDFGDGEHLHAVQADNVLDVSGQ